MKKPEPRTARAGLGGGNVGAAIRERFLWSVAVVALAIAAVSPLGRAVARCVETLNAVLLP